MESLIVFVIIAAINIFSKSVQEKRKIEKAKIEREKELKTNSIPGRPEQAQPLRERISRKKPNKNIDKREILKKQRQQEYLNKKQEYIDNKREKQENYVPGNYNYTIEEEKVNKTTTRESYADIAKRDGTGRLEVEAQEVTAEQLEAQQEIKQSFTKEGFERKKLINAIIWSEILKEPKSIENIKKGR